MHFWLCRFLLAMPLSFGNAKASDFPLRSWIANKQLSVCKSSIFRRFLRYNQVQLLDWIRGRSRSVSDLWGEIAAKILPCRNVVAGIGSRCFRVFKTRKLAESPTFCDLTGMLGCDLVYQLLQSKFPVCWMLIQSSTKGNPLNHLHTIWSWHFHLGSQI